MLVSAAWMTRALIVTRAAVGLIFDLFGPRRDGLVHPLQNGGLVTPTSGIAGGGGLLDTFAQCDGIEAALDSAACNCITRKGDPDPLADLVLCRSLWKPAGRTCWRKRRMKPLVPTRVFGLHDQPKVA
jgi:hypothetical protein